MRILHANIYSVKDKNQMEGPRTKPFVGTLDEDGFSISPRMPHSPHATLRIKGRFLDNGKYTKLELKFLWNINDILFNGMFLGCFAALSFFCIRHALHSGHFHPFDLLPPLTLLLAYFIAMLMFNMSVKNRKSELAELFDDQYIS